MKLTKRLCILTIFSLFSAVILTGCGDDNRRAVSGKISGQNDLGDQDDNNQGGATGYYSDNSQIFADEAYVTSLVPTGSGFLKTLPVQACNILDELKEEYTLELQDLDYILLHQNQGLHEDDLNDLIFKIHLIEEPALLAKIKSKLAFCNKVSEPDQPAPQGPTPGN